MHSKRLKLPKKSKTKPPKKSKTMYPFLCFIADLIFENGGALVLDLSLVVNPVAEN